MLSWFALTLLTTLANRPGPDATDASTPAGVVKAFYEAANKGAYTSAQGFFAPEAVPGIERVVGSFRAYCDSRTMRRTMIRIEILSEGIRGDEAEVRVRATFNEGLTISTEPLAKKNGDWRIIASRASQTDADWRALAILAEKQGRRADAWIFYRAAAALAPQDEGTLERIQRLWREMGGSEMGIRALFTLEAR